MLAWILNEKQALNAKFPQKALPIQIDILKFLFSPFNMNPNMNTICYPAQIIVYLASVFSWYVSIVLIKLPHALKLSCRLRNRSG